jgi:glucosamine-6-phosphate deaminase
MDIQIFGTPEQATEAAAQWLLDRFDNPRIRNVMVAAGNTPLPLYSRVARGKASLSHLRVFALDDYVGVPKNEPRNCANLLRRTVVEAWRVPPSQYRFVSSCEQEAAQSIIKHEEALRRMGGIDLAILGLGRNGHLGFNEPGTEPDSPGRVVVLNAVSIEANRAWFDGDYAPTLGVTTGMGAILSAREVLLLAFGPAKAEAVAAMIHDKPSPACPASFLQTHAGAAVFLDQGAADRLPCGVGGGRRGNLPLRMIR